MNGYSNATVQRNYDPWATGRGLLWEIRGYVDGTWVNIPHYSETAAQEHLATLERA